MTTKLPPAEAAEAVRDYAAQTMGTENYYEHWTRRVAFTDGARFVADVCGAHWLIDAIASHQTRKVRAEPFQVWTLERTKGQSVRLAATDGDKGDGPVKLAAQRIEYSDFPADLLPFTLYVERCGDHWVLMLPEER